MAIAEFLVSFREVFEICLVLGIMLAYLEKTGRKAMKNSVYAGAGLAFLASAASAAAFELLTGGFEKHEPLFEGILLILACLMVTWLNLWVLSNREIKKTIRRKIEAQASHGHALGVAAFSFVAVFREGVELALFLEGIAISSGAIDAGAALAGALGAAALSYALFRQAIRLDLQKFFKVTSILLVLLAAGLLSQGVHELQEIGVLPTSVEHIYDFTPLAAPDGSYPLLHEKGLIGSVLRIMVGYSTAPSLEQAVAYFGYLAAVCLAYARIRARGSL